MKFLIILICVLCMCGCYNTIAIRSNTTLESQQVKENGTINNTPKHGDNKIDAPKETKINDEEDLYQEE